MLKIVIPVLAALVMFSSVAVFAQSADGIPGWIKNTAKWWGDGSINDVEFINAMKYLIENDVMKIDSEVYQEDVLVKGELFLISYPGKSLQNPEVKGGVTYVETQPFFHFDESKELIYREIFNSNEPQKTVFVYPMFTQSAYDEPGFYTYYRGECDEQCLTIPIRTDLAATYTSSVNAAKILDLLGYDFITDMDVDKNPSILEQYDKVILLHNEYVTKTMFDAITSHPKVIYLYPNSLYGEVSTDYEQNTITLIRGHHYPEESIDNGFDWEFDNTRPYEFDNKCENWEFHKIDNGIMLNCYPEHIIFKDLKLLKILKEY